MRFDALEVSLEMVESLKKPLARIRRLDGNLFSQIRRAASSVALNIGEGNRRQGRDRRHHWNIAAGSAEEVRVALRTACSWGDLDEDSIAPSMELLDRVCAILWRLTH